MSTKDSPEATLSQTPDTPFMRVIKTYVLRAGRMGPGQTRAFEQFGAKFLVPFQHERLDVAASFGRQAPLILEIGFGMGDATAKIAYRRANDNFLCCEVHAPGVGALLKRCGEENIGNIRIVQHDAVEVMDHMLGDNSLDGVHIFFSRPLAQKPPPQTTFDPKPFCEPTCASHQKGRLFAPGHGLGTLCRANAAGAVR